MDSMLKGLSSAMMFAVDLLPDSPFKHFIDNIGAIPYIGYLNYFVPVSDFVALLAVWTTAIGLFYAVSAILRIAKAIE